MVPFACYNLTMKKHILILITSTLLLCSACSQTPGTQPITQNTPVTIAVIDTGFSSAAIPQQNILEGKNYLDQSLDTEDTYGHGTAIASVILNICPEALLVPLVSNAFDDGKIIQVDNDTFAQMIIDAVDVYGCDIINISAGLILDKDSVRDAIAYAEKNQVLVVASVGNDYEESGEFPYYPAAYDTVLAVGSMNVEETKISDFSQRGDWVDIYTCGEEVEIKTLSGNTRTSDGTSYSAAKVTAYAANLIKENDKKISVTELRQMIENNAETLGDGTKYIPNKYF